ncbi:Uu.00g144210.m01.CDS01 [Anthostomella pinea]|uniref:Uu.00g144210.m01.CDS01 n=1 Tax=Anthostomella pinea TaxID=933095 RepID=A0AAI8YLV7_9PEZI|nr:Uu.00g144210.m01.CDS01 [Anthostomella pinea]
MSESDDSEVARNQESWDAIAHLADNLNQDWLDQHYLDIDESAYSQDLNEVLVSTVGDRQRQPLTEFRYFWKLPIELRLTIFGLALPRRVHCIRSLRVYTTYPTAFPSVGIPTLARAYQEWWNASIHRGYGYRFENQLRESVRLEWFDRYNDLIYIQSLRVFNAWKGWSTMLCSATTVFNVLEVVEDRWRGAATSDIFTSLSRTSIFDRSKTFLLSMLTVECGDDLAIYGDNTTAMVDLDDENLPRMLKSVYDNVRSCKPANVPHKRPSLLLKHLRKEWDAGLKRLSEEQWLQSRLDVTAPKDPTMYTKERFGYKNRRFMLDRNHSAVEKLVRAMPEMRPVIVFEKRWPCFDLTMLQDHGSAAHLREPSEAIWADGRSMDGLESISNRRGMVLSYEFLVDRQTRYGPLPAPPPAQSSSG